MPLTIPDRLCGQLNLLAVRHGSWWQRIATDPEAIVRVDPDGVEVRLGGGVLLRVEARGDALHCRLRPELLLRVHPGARWVLSDAGLAPEPELIASLDDLGREYDAVRRRHCYVTDRRQAVLDRLYLRHAALVAVDAPLGSLRADLIGVSPTGVVVLYVVRRYADADVRLAGKGGLMHRLRCLDHWLDAEDACSEVAALVDRARLLHGPWSRRFDRCPVPVAVHPRARLLLVDFDHAQRLGGLPEVRNALLAGLDRTPEGDDILAIGDPGNISHRVLFAQVCNA